MQEHYIRSLPATTIACPVIQRACRSPEKWGPGRCYPGARSDREVWFSPAPLLRDGVCCGHELATTERRKPCPSEQEHGYF